MRRTIKAVLAVLVMAGMVSGVAGAAVLNGAGATFPYPLYMKMNTEYNKATGEKVNYQGIGSGGGIRQFTSGITDFGGSDAAMTDEQIQAAGGDVLHIPTVMGAVAICYNLKDVSLALDSDTLAGIFLGKIKKWNDARIKALNPGENLPDKPILVAHRSDGSGTTSIFSTYLARVSLEWASKVGAGKALSWPTGVGGKGNAGVAGVVKVNEGAIGYVELSYAVTNKLPVAELKNKAGKFIKPSLDSTSAAAAGALKDPKIAAMVANGDFRLNLTNAPGAYSYPIVGMTWLLVHKEKSGSKAGAIKKYLKWALTTGQQYAPKLLYAPLPDDVKAKVLEAVDSIKS